MKQFSWKVTKFFYFLSKPAQPVASYKIWKTPSKVASWWLAGLVTPAVNHDIWRRLHEWRKSAASTSETGIEAEVPQESTFQEPCRERTNRNIEKRSCL